MFELIYKNAKLKFPKVNIKYKDESLFMKILGKILFFNKGFNKYITTVGNTIYFGTKSDTENANLFTCSILVHELVHVYDSKLDKLFSVKYLLPQLVSVLLFVLGFFCWWFFILAALFLLPIPAYFRMKYEKRGYLMQIYALERMGVTLPKESIDYMKSQFKTSAYYFMWPFSSFEKEFDDFVQKKKVFEPEIYKYVDFLLTEK